MRLLSRLLIFVVLVVDVGTSFSQQTSIDPNQLVLQAVERAVWGPSLSCRVKQSSVWNEHEVTAEGMYWQSGGGAGQLKLQLLLDANGTKSDFLQVSDGRLVWSHLGRAEPPRRVYLDRIRESLGGWVRKPGIQPEAALYLAVGGQAETLRCLYQRYRWFKVFAGTDEQGREVWQLVGTIRSEPPNPSAQTKIDGILSSSSPPPQVPTDVRLTLGRDEKRFLFPYKIDYYRRLKVEGGMPGKLVRVSTVEHDEVVSPIETAPDFYDYRVNDDADQIQDETIDYMPLNPQAILKMPTRR